jgi:hypothetical protein
MTVTRTGNALRAVRTASADGNLCTYQGTIGADGVTVSGQGTCPSGYTFPFTLSLAPTSPSPAAPPGPPGSAPAPAPPAIGLVLGPLSLDGYCQAIQYTANLAGTTMEVIPFDGVVAEGDTLYCAALNVLESGIDVYSEPIDPNQACVWQYGPLAGARREGAGPLSWICFRG